MKQVEENEGINDYGLDEKGKQEFKDRLIALRKQKNWSQEYIAEKLDVSRQTVSKWESRQTMPEVDKVMKLSKIYDLTMDELVYGENKSVKSEIKPNSKLKDKILKKYLPRIIGSVALIILIAYLISVVHNFIILKELNNKFEEYKNVDNCYYERKELVTDDAGAAYMLNTRYWYKDGILKTEEKRSENGVTKTAIIYIDTNKNERYVLSEENRSGTKKINYIDYKDLENSIIDYLIGENYYESNFEIIKDACLSKVSKDKNNYIVERNIKEYKKNIYNKETALIEQTFIKNEKETKIVHNIKINSVTDEDITLNIDGYNIRETK